MTPVHAVRFWALAVLIGSSFCLPAISLALPATAPSDLSREIKIQRGRSEFEAGDTIIITSVRGPTDSMAAGNTYQVEGAYILSSHDDARLVAGVTPLESGTPDATPDPNQSALIEKGIGKFSLTLPMPAKGYPFLSFNSSSGDVSFGQLYFGTTGSLLKVSADTNDDSSSAQATVNPPHTTVGLDVSTAENGSTFVPFTSQQPPIAPAPASFPMVVNFQNGAHRFLAGDDITIKEIRGTAATFQPGNWYQITGIYSLSSQTQACLATFVTAAPGANGNCGVDPGQVKMIGGGTGDFVLLLPMLYPGNPHVSFYPSAGGASFGSIYFGTGNSTLQSIPDGLDDTLQYSQTDSYVPPPGTLNNSPPTMPNPQPIHPTIPVLTPLAPQPIAPTDGGKGK